MYVPNYHTQPDPNAAQALIATHPLGAWVCTTADGLVANHLPFIFDASRGASGTLLGHVSRANPVWRQLAPAQASVVMFQEAHSYITPNWYPSKAEHGKVVPTWNYSVAHAHGVARAVTDAAWLLDLLTRLTAANEADQPVPWRVADAPADFINKLLAAVVGIEIVIDRIECKLKLSQDEALPDRLGTVAGLNAACSDSKSAMAVLVQRAVSGESSGQWRLP